MTLVCSRRWPDHDPILRDWRFRRRMGMLDEKDQPAALDMKADEDGCLHMVPLTIEGVMVWAEKLLVDESEALD